VELAGLRAKNRHESRQQRARSRWGRVGVQCRGNRSKQLNRNAGRLCSRARPWRKGVLPRLGQARRRDLEVKGHVSGPNLVPGANDGPPDQFPVDGYPVSAAKVRDAPPVALRCQLEVSA
jgi:hypothetical protein